MKVFSHEELVELLAARLDRDMVDHSIVETARELGYGPLRYDRDEALAIFEALAQREEALGIAARFAKARLLLS